MENKKRTKSRTVSKSPLKDTISSKSKKKRHLIKKNKRAITPVIHKTKPSAIKFTRNSKRDQAPFVFTNQENSKTGLSIGKWNESDELESIEQDIANLDKIKNFGKISDQFIFELDETEEQLMNQQRMKSPTDLEWSKNIFKKQP